MHWEHKMEECNEMSYPLENLMILNNLPLLLICSPIYNMGAI